MDLSLIEKHFEVKRTARFFQSCEITPHTSEVFIVFHGYAMHAGYFLKKFEPLFNPTNCFIAPEGLNRFYSKGVNGYVVASWMTKEFREFEIDDYINYIENLVTSIMYEKNIKLNLIGFSQGCATLARWYNKSAFHANKIIFHSGTFPPDIQNFDTLIWKKSSIEVIIGNKDKFFSANEYLNTFNLLNQNQIKFNFKEFNGDHEINIDMLRSII